MTTTEGLTLVAGGFGTVGRAIVDRISKNGDAVVVLDAQEPPAAFPHAHYAVDVTDADAVAEVVAEVRRIQSAPPVKLVYTVGVGPRYKDTLDLTSEEFLRAVDVNVLGAVNIVRAMREDMVRLRYGRVVGISSVTGRGGWRARSEYAASKAMLESVFATLAIELGPFGVTVNCVAPGHMRTAMTDGARIPWEATTNRTALGRLVTPAEVSAAVTYFLDSDAAAVTGAVLHVDAGYLVNQLPVQHVG